MCPRNTVGVLFWSVVLCLSSFGFAAGQFLVSCPYTHADGRPCGGETGFLGQGPDCTNPNCPGPTGNRNRSNPNAPEGRISDGDIDIDFNAAERWQAKKKYIDAARRAHPDLRGKKVRVTVGPSNEVEFFVDGQSVTHLVWPVIETMENEKLPRVPVVAGIYDVPKSATGRMQIEQQGKNISITNPLANGGSWTFKGTYQVVERDDGTKVTGFFGPASVLTPEGTKLQGQILINPVLGSEPGFDLEGWIELPDGTIDYTKARSVASRDESGKIIAGPRF